MIHRYHDLPVTTSNLLVFFFFFFLFPSPPTFFCQALGQVSHKLHGLNGPLRQEQSAIPEPGGALRPKRRRRSEGQRGRRGTRLRLRLGPQPRSRAVPAAAHTPPPAEEGRGRAPALRGGGGTSAPLPRPHAWGSARRGGPACSRRPLRGSGRERSGTRPGTPAPRPAGCSALPPPPAAAPRPAHTRRHTALRRPGPHPSPGRGEAAAGRPGLRSHAAATPRRPPPRLGPALRGAHGQAQPPRRKLEKLPASPPPSPRVP